MTNEEYIYQDLISEEKIPDSLIIACCLNAVIRINGVKELNSKDIKVEQKKDGINIDVYVIVNFGASIPELSWNIQNAIKKEVETMVEKSIKAINIHIQGLSSVNKRARRKK